MATMRDALRKALAEKRAQVIRDQGHIKPSVADGGKVKGVVYIKHVRCTRCNGMESWQAFNMNGAKPTFCKCKPGDEDLVAFDLKVGTPEPEDDDDA